MTNQEKSYAALGEELVSLLTKRGLGAIPKRDLDALLIFLLEKHLGWSSRTNQELSILLRLPVPKIKSLRYEGALRYTQDLDGEFRRRLRRLLRLAAFSEDKKSLQFVVEDYATRFVLEEYLKKQGRVAQWSFNDEAITAPIPALAVLIADQFDEKERTDALARLGITDPEKFSSVVERAFLEIIDEAKKSQIVKLANIGTKVAITGPAKALAKLLFG